MVEVAVDDRSLGKAELLAVVAPRQMPMLKHTTEMPVALECTLAAMLQR